MTREDFSKRLRQYRDLNNISLKELCNRLDVLQNSLYNIEKGVHNYGMDKAIKYANAVNANIVVTSPNRKGIVISSEEAARIFLIMARGDKTMFRVAKDLGYSPTGLSNSENGVSALSIDMVLKLAEYYGYVVTVKAK